MSFMTTSERIRIECRLRHLISMEEDDEDERTRRRLHPLNDVNCHFINSFTGETLFYQNLKEHEETLVSVGYVFRLVKDKLGCNNFYLKVGTT